MCRLSETAGRARLSLVGARTSELSRRHDNAFKYERGRLNGCVAVDIRSAAPLNKAQSVACCRSLESDAPPASVRVSWWSASSLWRCSAKACKKRHN